MQKLILASVALVGLSGAALAQEAPALIYGDAYEQNVKNASDGFSVDFTGTAAIAPAYDNASAVTLDNVNTNENYSGR